MLIAPLGERQHRASPMAHRSAWLLGALVSLSAGCASQPSITPRQPIQRGSRSSALRVDGAKPTTALMKGHAAARSATPLEEAEKGIATRATLPALIRLALARSPEIAEARHRLRAAREGDPSGARLPDPEIEYQLWAQPLGRPYALDEAEMHMVGVRQAFPAPGTLGARAEAAKAQANVAAEAQRAREQDIELRVRRAFAEYYRADREFSVHLEHVGLAQQVVDVARAAYQGGRGNQRDVLRASLEMARLHNDVANIERDRVTARALLNTLMARAPDAPIGPPGALEPPSEGRAAELESNPETRRPEIAAAKYAVQSRTSDVQAMQASALWPSFMFGLQYMYAPIDAEPHNYGVMLSMSVPWFNTAHAEALRAAEANLAAEESALSSAQLAARYERYEATERLRAARRTATTIESDLLPLAQQSVESAEAAYRGGQSDLASVFDALNALLDIRIERERARVRVDLALADLDRAAGGGSTPFAKEHE